jgi:NAD+ synthase (glutamine-hydrolysing)
VNQLITGDVGMVEIAILEGMKIGLCQQACIPSDPGQNADTLIHEIELAEKQNVDLLVGVEGLQGYLIGDQYEFSEFQQEVADANSRVLDSTRDKSVAVAYGSLIVNHHERGEDGRNLRRNGGYIIQRGELLRVANKTDSPNYRMFAEARYFSNNRLVAEAISLNTGRALGDVFKTLLQPVRIRLRSGLACKIGQQFCEDMWEDDYSIKPTEILANNGADVIVNHSASPWTSRKNQKRHRVVKNLIQRLPLEVRPRLFVYVNRVGIEQSLKNIYVYDGSSSIYDADGDLIYEAPSYESGTKIFTFSQKIGKIQPHVPSDTGALYDAMACVIDSFFGSLPEPERHVYVGLSGGLDSSLVAALLVSRPCLGPERIVGVNMPFRDYNSDEGKSDARQLAANLGIGYLVRPIDEIVDALVNSEPEFDSKDALNYGNLQAMARMLVLNQLSKSERRKGLFTCQSNKTEMAFGYGTLWGDMAGAIALIADLVKREEHELADYLNRVIYERTVIPTSVFTRRPSAELEHEQFDPFDYGDLHNRGYHDEWVRAVTEMRWSPATFLREYRNGTLASSLGLPESRLKALFPTTASFIERLEVDWTSFRKAFIKRDKAPFIPIFSRRAFGGDLSESIFGFPASEDYLRQKNELLSPALPIRNP